MIPGLIAVTLATIYAIGLYQKYGHCLHGIPPKK